MTSYFKLKGGGARVIFKNWHVLNSFLLGSQTEISHRCRCQHLARMDRQREIRRQRRTAQMLGFPEIETLIAQVYTYIYITLNKAFGV